MNYIFREQAQWYGSELGQLLAVSQATTHESRELMATRPLAGHTCWRNNEVLLELAQ